MQLKSSLLLFLSCVITVSVFGQTPAPPRLGVYAGYSPMRQHYLIPEPMGEFAIIQNRAFQAGLDFAMPITESGLEVGLSAALLGQRLYFAYLGPGTYDTDALGSVQLQSLLLTPSVAWRPAFAKGFFVDLGLPVALATGNKGKFTHTTTTVYSQYGTDHFSELVEARNEVYTGPELGLGYRMRLGGRISVSGRVAGWMPVTDLFHANDDLIPTFQQRIRPSVQAGLAFDLKAG